MSIGTEPGQYILQTQFRKNSEGSMGGVWVRRWAYLKLRQETNSGQPAEVNVW